MEKLLKSLEAYSPCCEQEERDLAIMLDWLKNAPCPFSRENEVSHITASAWIVNPARTRALMVWHNLYRSWSWTGGHADGETDLLAVAIREAQEETGVDARPVTEDVFSVETLVVEGHEKRGRYVPCHLHMNVTYLLEADDSKPLRIKPDENSGVSWIPVEQIGEKVSEPWMMARIYAKLIEKCRSGGEH